MRYQIWGVFGLKIDQFLVAGARLVLCAAGY